MTILCQKLFFYFEVDVLARMVQKGIGIGISKWASTKEILTAINTVISDRRYRLNLYKYNFEQNIFVSGTRRMS